MREKCFDEGTIQAFLDGELASDLLENVVRHIALCDDCAILMAEAEEESAVAFTAIEQEFNTLVPTQRLWTKINESIGKEKKSTWHTVFAFFSNPTIAAFASLLVVFGLFMTFLSLQKIEPVNIVAQNGLIEQKVNTPVFTTETASQTLPKNDLKSPQAVVGKAAKKDSQIIKTNFVLKAERPKDKKSVENVIGNSDLSGNKEQPKTDNYLSGEDTYLKTIAALEQTANSRKDEVLKPSARFAYEKDLAVVNDAIKRMKQEVKTNPKDEAAKNVLRASYQNKIDLLNSVAEKTELMASLKY